MGFMAVMAVTAAIALVSGPRTHARADAAATRDAARPAGTSGRAFSPEAIAACAAIRPEALRGHVEFLADDLLLGREPGTAGYDIAAAYVASQFRALGLAPAGTEGYMQPIRFIASVIRPSGCAVTVTRAGVARPLVWSEDFLMYGDVQREAASVEADAVFVGFGVSAPELGYDDYAGLNVRGKIVVYLSGAPRRFPNDQRAYHSLSRRKRELAARRGAIGVVGMRTPQDFERSPWASSVRRVGSPNLARVDARGRALDVEPSLQAAASLSPSGTAALFAGAARTLDEVFEAAEASKPPRFALGARLRLQSTSAHHRLTSANVVARIDGADPRLRHEAVIYTAHLDHLGVTAPVRGDSINNGAHDNGTGIAALIETARAFRALPAPPRRSILFLATTAEEQGLEGAYHYAGAPTFPIDRIVANVNMDMFLLLHPLHDMVAHGAEHSSLGAVVEDTGRHLGFRISPDPSPEEVVFIRSDQFPFVLQGVPAVFLDAGHDTGDPDVDGAAMQRQWRRTVYHSPQDDLSQPMDWTAGATWARANFLIGWRVANDEARPTWHRGDFFGDRFGRRRGARR